MERKKLVMVLLIVLMVTFMSLGVFAYHPEDYVGEIDLNGETITIIEPNPKRFNENYDLIERVEEAEELYNCNIETMKINWPEKLEVFLSRLMSDDSKYDIWRAWDADFFKLVGRNAILPLSEIFPEYYNQFKYPEAAYGYQGKQYALTAPGERSGKLTYIAWNIDLFEELGLPNLYDFYDQGSDVWNWETFEEVASQATTGDYIGIESIMRDGGALFQANGVEWFVEDENGKYQYNVNSPEAKETVRFIRGLLEKGVANGWGQDFVNGLSAMRIANSWQLQQKFSKGDFRVGCVPLPVGPSYNKDGFCVPMSGMNSYVIPVNAEAPKGLAVVFSYIFYSDPEESLQKSKEINMQWVSDEKSFDIIMNETWTGELNLWKVLSHKGSPAFYKEGIQPVLSGNAEMSILDELEPAVQARLNELMGYDQ